MDTFKRTIAATIALVSLLGFSATAAALDVEAGTDKIYIPDYVRTQFAGDLGMLSVGPGFAFFDRHLSFDLTYGFTPLQGGGVIHQGNFELMGDPIHLNLSNRLEFHPVRAGFSVSLLAGSDFWRTPPDRFGESYEGLNTRIFYGPSLGSVLFLDTAEGGLVDGMDFYWRASMNNLNADFRDDNGDAVGLSDVISLGFGIRMYL